MQRLKWWAWALVLALLLSVDWVGLFLGDYR